jgi:hypothetical protein
LPSPIDNRCIRRAGVLRGEFQRLLQPIRSAGDFDGHPTGRQRSRGAELADGIARSFQRRKRLRRTARLRIAAVGRYEELGGRRGASGQPQGEQGKNPESSAHRSVPFCVVRAEVKA